MESIKLTTRQRTILECACAGWTDKEIADHVCLSQPGVKWNIERLKELVNAVDRKRLTFLAGVMMMVEISEVNKLSSIKANAVAEVKKLADIEIKNASLKHLVVAIAIVFGMAQESSYRADYDFLTKAPGTVDPKSLLDDPEPQRRPAPQRVSTTRANMRTFRVRGREFNFVQNEIDLDFTMENAA